MTDTKPRDEDIKMNENKCPDGNVHTMPLDKDHIESKLCWCEPELVDDFTKDGGLKHYLHKEVQ